MQGNKKSTNRKVDCHHEVTSSGKIWILFMTLSMYLLHKTFVIIYILQQVAIFDDNHIFISSLDCWYL